MVPRVINVWRERYVFIEDEIAWLKGSAQKRGGSWKDALKGGIDCRSVFWIVREGILVGVRIVEIDVLDDGFPGFTA